MERLRQNRSFLDIWLPEKQSTIPWYIVQFVSVKCYISMYYLVFRNINNLTQFQEDFQITKLRYVHCNINVVTVINCNQRSWMILVVLSFAMKRTLSNIFHSNDYILDQKISLLNTIIIIVFSYVCSICLTWILNIIIAFINRDDCVEILYPKSP